VKPASAFLVAGIACASLTEAVSGTALSIARFHIGGDAHATPDELASLDVAYTALKLVAFMSVPWLLTRIRPRNLIAGSTVIMGAACLVAAMTARLDLLLALRAVQGLAGGTLLVAGQTIIFLAFARHRQPLLQALFAMGSVVAPATITPALGGLLLDHLSWAWIFFSVVPLSLAASGLILLADEPAPPAAARRAFDWLGFALVSTALCCFTWVLSQGSRWNWFDEPRIVWLAIVGVAALLAFLGQQVIAGPRGLLDWSLFRSNDFTFACAVSLVAGAALFGSAFLIPSFAVSRLAFTPTDVGLLLLPGSAVFIAALLVSAYLMQARRVPPIATVPPGILLIMLAMWMLSGSTSESGAGDLAVSLLLRGSGLGLLFLSITLVAFGSLPDRSLACGIGLFNTGRQLGGLVGVAALQTLIDHEAAANLAVLGANVTAGVPAVGERLAVTAAMLVAKGQDPAAAAAVSASLLGRAVAGQSGVIAFATAFNAIALLFVVAAPALIGFKVALGRRRSGAEAPRRLKPSARR
jgi:DHA2 family multidrug resistance protein